MVWLDHQAATIKVTKYNFDNFINACKVCSKYTALDIEGRVTNRHHQLIHNPDLLIQAG